MTETITVLNAPKTHFGERVRVYRNLHKKLLSVVLIATGRVIFYTDRLCLQDVRFRVREGGRQRVLREKRKNVHAFVEGTLLPPEEAGAVRNHLQSSPRARSVRYNPYEAGHFQSRPADAASDGSPVAIHRAQEAYVALEGILAWPWRTEDQTACAHSETSSGWTPVQNGGIYTFRKCDDCGKEFHDNEKMKAAGLQPSRRAA